MTNSRESHISFTYPTTHVTVTCPSSYRGGAIVIAQYDPITTLYVHKKGSRELKVTSTSLSTQVKDSSNMFQFQLLGATVVFDVHFSQNILQAGHILEATFKITFPYAELEIKGKMTIGCANMARHGVDHMV